MGPYGRTRPTGWRVRLVRCADPAGRPGSQGGRARGTCAVPGDRRHPVARRHTGGSPDAVAGHGARAVQVVHRCPAIGDRTAPDDERPRLHRTALDGLGVRDAPARRPRRGVSPNPRGPPRNRGTQRRDHRPPRPPPLVRRPRSAICRGLGVVEVGENRKYASVVAVVIGDAELPEQRRGVFADGALTEEEAPADGLIGEAFGHQAEYVSFSLGELAELLVRGAGREEFGDDGRVHRRTARGDAFEGIDELVSVEHTLLEQVSDAAGAVGKEFAGVELLDVLRENQYRKARDFVARGKGCAQAFVRLSWWHPDVDDGDVGPQLQQGFERLRSGARGRDDLVAVRLDQSDDPVAEQVEVFGYKDSHGTTILTLVGPPTGLVTSQTPSKTASRRRRPSSPPPGRTFAPPWPSSSTSTTRSASLRVMAMRACVAWACLTVLVSSSAMAKYRADSIGGSRLSLPLELTMTSSGLSRASARTASTRPRSLRTGGLMPWISSRSSVSDVAAPARASRIIALACSGSISINFSAVASDSPRATSRAWAPSCRSRSIRRISAA